MESRLLFVTNRNILTTCGELRLIKNRAEVLYRAYGIPTDFIVLANSARINSMNKETISAGGTVQTIRQDIGSPLSILSARNELTKELKERILSNKYDGLVFSGSGMPFFAKLIKKIRKDIFVIADVHGASEDILELVKGSSLKKRLINWCIYKLDVLGLSKSRENVDGYFAVTEALKKYLKERYRTTRNVKYYIVPCATVNVNDRYFENYSKYREEYRKKYSISENTKVFIYSGGVSKWQCIEETIQLYDEISEAIQDTVMLMFSHNVDSITELIKGKSIIVDSYSPDELTKALCAGDFAFMLRTDCITNNVAFPNKFLEYVQSKMKIITTPYVKEIEKQVRERELGYLYNFDEDITDLISYIEHEQHNSDEMIKRVLHNNSFEVRLSTLAQDLKTV